MRRAALPLALLLVATLLAPAVLPPAVASPQPSPVCGFCGSAFEDAAQKQGVNASVEESIVVVQVHENGTATWVVRNRLSLGADEFRGDRDRLNRTAEWLAENHWGLPDDPSFVSARMDGDAVVLTYRDPDAAERRAGLLVVDYLHEGGREPWYHVNAERFTIRGPPGTVVTNDPDSGHVGDGIDRTTGNGEGADPGGGVTWRGNSSGPVYEGTDVEGSPYVVFGPDRSPVTQARTAVALALATFPIVVESLQSYLLYQTAAFAVGLAVVVAFLRSRTPGGRVERWAGIVAILGALGAVVPAVTNGIEWVFGPPLFGVGAGLLALHPRTRDRLETPREQALVSGGVLVATFGVVVGLNAVLASSWPDPVGMAVRVTALAFPLAAMLPLGGALDAGRDRLLAWGGLAVVAFAAVPVATVNFADPPSGFGSGFLVLALFAFAVLAPLVGTIVIVLGRSLAVGSESK